MKYLYLFLFVGLLCPALSFAQTQTTDTVTARFFIDAGINSTSTKVSGADELSGAKASSSVFPTLNLGTDIYFNKQTRRLALKADVGFTQNKAAFTVDGNSGIPYTVFYNFTQTMLALDVKIAYNVVNSANFKFYLALGGAMDYGFYSKMDHYITYHVSPTTSSTSTLDPIAMSNIFFNVSDRIGVLLNNRFEIYVSALPSYNLTNYATLAVNSTSYRAGVGYVFGR